MMSLSQAAAMVDGTLIGADVMFTAVSKDTRSISKGALYVALKGERFDGHEFIDAASDAGAVAALVSEATATNLSQLQVKDTHLALGQLAAGWRKNFQGNVIGITGSNGKTTVKEMCRCILVQSIGEQKVMSTQGNFNNDIGLPMTLLEMKNDHEFAVIEMGANHIGEIDYLTKITAPDVAVITNAGAAHIEGFGSVENVAQAKSEIFNGLSDHGIAIINADDKYCDYWKRKNNNRKVVTFSALNVSADVVAQNITGKSFLLKTRESEALITLRVPGVHNIMNALAATAATLSVGADLKSVVIALEKYTGVKGRLQFSSTKKGATVIDDSYNANPLSLVAAIDVLVEMDGEPWLILGDMGELGESAEALHKEAGALAKKKGVKRLFATGNYSRYAVEAFGEGAEFFDDKDTISQIVSQEMTEKTNVLVKGSRSMKMENIVSELMGTGEQLKSNKVNC